jgi:hypothetical protein
MLTNIHFTDPQGIEHADAVFVIRTSSEQINSNKYKNLSSTDFTTFEEGENNPEPYVNFEVYYWASASSKAAGAAPYILVNPEQIGMSFSFIATEAYLGLDLEGKVDKYLTDVVLPSMLVID